jgi:hypothetical protein
MRPARTCHHCEIAPELFESVHRRLRVLTGDPTAGTNLVDRGTERGEVEAQDICDREK